jgi:hypothetical protein
MMKRLDEKNWVPVPIADLFDKPVAGKGKGLNHLIQADKMGVCYIGATNRNNGVLCFIKPDEISKNMMQPGNCIGFIKNGDGSAGYAIYKHEPFISTSDVIYGYAGWVNKFTGLFFVAAQDKIKNKYSHGYKRNEQHLHGDKVMLPVTNDGKPDYKYMVQYASEMRRHMLMRYRNYVTWRLFYLEHRGVPTLSEKKWGEFRIGELFSVSHPSARNKDDYEFGDTLFIASGALNNGVMKCCKAKGQEQLDEGNCITVSPIDGSTFYQPRDFLGRGGAGSSILILRCFGMNLYRGQFMARMIQQTCSKYTYGHMGNKKSIKRERIMLPVTDDGVPDYEYMEQYVKNMMLRKYRQYLSFINAK